MSQLTSSFYRANLEKKISSRLQAERTLGVNSMIYDCVRLIWVKKPGMKGVPSWGKIPDGIFLVVQNTLWINIAMTHPVLYFPACKQDSHSGGNWELPHWEYWNCTWTELSLWGSQAHWRRLQFGIKINDTSTCTGWGPAGQFGFNPVLQMNMWSDSKTTSSWCQSASSVNQ